MTDREGMEKVLKSAISEHPIDLVVANAGVSPETINTPDMDATQGLIAVNCTGVVNTVIPALKEFIDGSKRRQIAIVASTASYGALVDFTG